MKLKDASREFFTCKRHSLAQETRIGVLLGLWGSTDCSSQRDCLTHEHQIYGFFKMLGLPCAYHGRGVANNG